MKSTLARAIVKGPTLAGGGAVLRTDVVSEQQPGLAPRLANIMQ